MPESKSDQCRIDPLVVFKLGQELVSDETQALLELIKNAYDADASFVRVTINTAGAPDGSLMVPAEERPRSSKTAASGGRVVIIENGST